MVIYLAGPLFTEGERAWMRGLKQSIIDMAERIGVAVEAMWPWEFVPQAELDAMGEEAGKEIFRICASHLEAADMLIALLDGPLVDDGTAWEIGFFYRHRGAAHRPIIGIRTDIRNAGERANSIANAMIEHSCDHIFRSSEDLLSHLRDTLSGKAALTR